MSARRSGRTLRVAGALVGLAAALAAGAAVVRVASREAAAPARCGPGFVSGPRRCCAPGQHEEGRACRGAPSSCPPGLAPAERAEGCAAPPRRVRLPGGALRFGAQDWQSAGVVAPREVQVGPFVLDAMEVTHARWASCVAAGSCRELAPGEPGLPVTGVEARDAERFCRHEGGRLPTEDEWHLAAAGPEGRRFPWGPSGLVCRRATFAVVGGACGDSGGPELAGAHPDGATPEGVHDLAGNVAEWTQASSGGHTLLGGSFRSKGVAELASWAPGRAPAAGDDVGLRCAYEAGSPGGAD